MGTVAKLNIGGSDHLIASTAYATCPTAAATAAKVATVQDSQAFTLITGTTVHVKFTYDNDVASPTLNVNGTGAKNIYRYGTTAPSTAAASSWNAGAVVSFTYDGSAWIMNDWLNNDTNTKVTQTNRTTDATYNILFSVDTSTTSTKTNATYKTTNLTYNPGTKLLTNAGSYMSNGKDVFFGTYSASSAPSSPVTGQLWLKDATMTLEEAKVLVVSTTTSSLPTTISDSNITADMELLKGELSVPSVQSSDLTIETTAGSVTISGTITGSTTIKLWLMRGR